jgi:cell wall-associated NlpC family hydrolase
MAKIVNGVLYGDDGAFLAFYNPSTGELTALDQTTVIGNYKNGKVEWNAAGKAAGYGGAVTVTEDQQGTNTTTQRGDESDVESDTDGPVSSQWTPYGYQRMIQEAYGYEGMQYRLGGTGADGTIDCSGLTQAAFAKVGINLPHKAQEQYRMGAAVSKGDLRPGDLVFFGGGPNNIVHVAIYLGNGQVLTAGDGHGSTSVQNITYRRDYVGARRIEVGYSYKQYGPTPARGQYTDEHGTRTSAADQAAIFASSKEAVDDIFYEQLGRPATDSEANMIIDGNWSQDHVIRYLRGLAEWGPSAPGYDSLRAEYQSIWTDLIGMTPVPEATMKEWITKNLTAAQVKERIRAMPEYATGNEAVTSKYNLIHEWETRTGRPMSALVQATLATALKEQWTMARWDTFIEEQPEYLTGVEYTGKKAVVTDVLRGMWGEGAVDAKLAADPDYVENIVWAELGKNADPSVIRDWARKQPEWLSGPDATSARVGLADYWGSIMRTPITLELLDQAVLEGWNKDQMLEHMRGTPEYKAYYAAKPAWLTEEQFVADKMSFDAMGRWYFRNDNFSYSNEQLTYFFEHGITAEEMGQRYSWTEKAAEQLADAKGSWAYYLEAVGITLTSDMAYTMASGAEGSGALFAALLKGQNRRSFDEAFTLYTGHAPSAGDYAYLESHYMSANEYAQRMGAYEYSTEMFPQVNELFQRVYGYEANLEELQNVALGAEGSGAYKALITAAEELDRYTLPWREYARTDPTPAQYAQWAGFAGPSELEKLLRARELVRSKGREIMDVYNSYWVMLGAAPITNEDILTLQGEYMGWGAIDERLNMAADHRERQEQARSQWLSGQTAQAYTVASQFGGPQVPFLRRPQG